MNKLSKLLALILALSLVLGMSAAVWATDNTGLTVSVNSQYEDRVYKAYKIFAGEIEDNTDADDFGNGNTRKLSNIEWADGIDGAAMITALNGIDAVKTANGDSEIAAGTSASDVAEILSKITDKDALIAISKVFYDK